MSRQKIVAGNWKMNTLLPEALQLTQDILSAADDADSITKILFPPFPFIHEVKRIVGDRTFVHLGAQNCSAQAKGAYTGDVSADMLRSVGCGYVLIGHSERRQYFKETADQLRLKMEQALIASLKPIYCIGETLDERKAGTHYNVVKAQLAEVLGTFHVEQLKDLVLAYEPVWAIGTGETATSAQAQDMHAYIRQVLGDLFDAGFAQNISLLYGGSCNAQNARELFSCADVDGGLIGGASLKAGDFVKIIASF